MRFFVDNNLSPHIARALHALSEKDGHKVIHLSDRFPRRIADEDWLAELGRERDWVVLSADFDIHKNPQRRRIWGDARLTTFFLEKGWLKQRFWEQAWWLVRWWPRILEVAGTAHPGSGYRVPAKPHGKLAILE